MLCATFLLQYPEWSFCGGTPPAISVERHRAGCLGERDNLSVGNKEASKSVFQGIVNGKTYADSHTSAIFTCQVVKERQEQDPSFWKGGVNLNFYHSFLLDSI